MLRAIAAADSRDRTEAPVRLLLIEDSQADARFISALLEEHGSRFEVEHVSYLAAGLVVLDQGGVGLVLADLTLPDSRAMETVETLLARAPEVPLVVLTGLADEALAASAVRHGAQDYLIKGQVDAPLLARSLRYAVERKAFEAALARSHQRLQALFDNALDAILLMDGEGRYIAANPAAEVLTGYCRDELCRMTIGDLTPEPARKHRQELWRDFLARGTQRGELALLRRDGTTVPVAYRAVAHIQPGVHLAFLDDLSERLQAEEERRKQEERYRRFFYEGLTGDAVATPDGRILTCNPAFAEIFGFDSVDEALTTRLPELFPDVDLRRDFVRRIRRERRLERFAMTGRRKNGEEIYVIGNVIGTFDPAGALVDLHGYLFDDTERHQAEQQLRQAQKMEAVGRLAGGVAHDFNNMVTAITGYSELLLARLAPEAPERKELEEIRHAGERAATLTRQLLAFSRSQVMRPTVLDLNDVVAGTEGMLQRLLGEDVRLFTALAQEPVRARADRGQLEQVILNLVVNARDAMPRGGRLTIETAAVELAADCARKGVVIEPGPYVMLAVTDTGEGMPPEVVDRVFEPFFTTKEPGKGTGLGLSTAYGIVKQSGGYIFASSEPGEGTTLRVYLPRIEASEEREARPAAARPHPGRGETVLVVEDEDSVRNLIVQILHLRGYSVLQASNGEQALALCRAERGIDLVITDVVMPDMRGPELGQELAKVAPGTRVLFISGYPGATIVHRGELSEGTPFLQKPFTHDDLVGKVRELLDRSVS